MCRIFFFFIDGTQYVWYLDPHIYTIHLKEMLGLADQHGILKYFYGEAINVVLPNKETAPENNDNQITMEHLLHIFLIFGFGHCLAFCVFLIEILFYYNICQRYSFI